MMAAYTGPDGTRWMAKVQEYVREHRLDAIVHETVQNPPYLADAMRAYRDAGYRGEAQVMGVPRALSQQGILHRYHEQVRTRGHGRLTVPVKADASYTGILEGADAIDKHHLVDLVAVYRRGEATPRYLNTRDDNGQWSKPPALRTAIETERSRALSGHELAEFQRTQTRLRGEMEDAWRSDLDQVDQLAREVDASRQERPLVSSASIRSRSTATGPDARNTGATPASATRSTRPRTLILQRGVPYAPYMPCFRRMSAHSRPSAVPDRIVTAITRFGVVGDVKHSPHQPSGAYGALDTQ